MAMLNNQRAYIYIHTLYHIRIIYIYMCVYIYIHTYSILCSPAVHNTIVWWLVAGFVFQFTQRVHQWWTWKPRMSIDQISGFLPVSAHLKNTMFSPHQEKRSKKTQIKMSCSQKKQNKKHPHFSHVSLPRKKTYVSSTVWVWVKIGYLTHG